MKKTYLKLWALCSLTLAFAACSDEDTTSSSLNAPQQSFLTTRLTVKNSDQSRANSVATWSKDHTDSWVDKLTFELPASAVDVTKPNFDRSGSVYYVPADFSGEVDLGWIGLNDGAKFYNYGTVTAINNVNYNGKVTFYNAGTLTYSVSSGQRHTVVNTGTLTVNNYANIGEVYNSGELVLNGQKDKIYPDWNNWHAVEVIKADIPNAMSIYSNGGVVEMPAEFTDFKAACDIHNTVYATGDVKIQNSQTQYICGLEVKGTLDMTQGHLETSYVKAKEITFDGSELWLTKEAYVGAEKMSMPNSATAIHGYDDSYALVEVGEISFQNTNNFNDSFSSNVYLKIDGAIDFSNSTLFGGQGKHFNSVSEYLADFAGDEARFNGENISGNPACGAPYGTPGTTPDEPGTPDEPTGPTLEEIGSIDAPDHDHDADKGNPNRPHLSATCIDYKDGTFYVSYHMRGGFQSGEHYGGDTFDKDGVEGCIETWTLAENEQNSTEIKLGHYMWTNAFDFNHLILDGGNIVTVGHLADKGAIIGKLPNPFTNVNADEGNVDTWSAEFSYKYLTTDEALMDGSVRLDYKNAGDGNCVIKNGNEYFVATYAGYGKLDSEFNRIKDAAGNVAFVSTPGSAKHLIEKDGDIAVLYLDSRPETTATATSTATVATISAGAYPFGGTTTALPNFVQPIDGKNVLAWNGVNLYACLGKGGLSVNGEVYSFGAEGNEPVNGVAIDDDYVYVASGSHLRVLDVTTNEEVAKVAIPYMSANYIKVATIDGEKYIAVAFGQAGIKVYRLKK